MRLPRMTIGHWMIVVAGASLTFALFGVTTAAAMVIAAFLLSATIAQPRDWREWLTLLIGALAALPAFFLASVHTFAMRAALFLGHWPSYDNPDPKTLPDRFHPQSEFLEVLIPVGVSVALTSLFALLIRRVRSPLSISHALIVGMALAGLSFILLILDPAGALNWIMD
jgi:hypothetical protein